MCFSTSPVPFPLFVLFTIHPLSHLSFICCCCCCLPRWKRIFVIDEQQTRHHSYSHRKIITNHMQCAFAVRMHSIVLLSWIIQFFFCYAFHILVTSKADTDTHTHMVFFSHVDVVWCCSNVFYHIF